MKTTKTTKEKLIAKYHVLAKAMTADEKDALLGGYGVKSSKDLDIKNLADLVEKLGGSRAATPADSEENKWRKRVIASICAWRRVTSMDEDMNTVKGIACRAAGYDNFNKIPVSQLRNVYYEFVRKVNVTKNTDKVTGEIIKTLTNAN